MSKHSEDKKNAVKIITECAKKYEKNLLGRTLLFVCMDKHKQVTMFELRFEAGNFMHLTGCHPIEKPVLDADGKWIGREKMSAPDFFKHCVNSRLSEDDFEFSSNKTTPLKMKILPQLMERDISANQIGEFSGNGLLLACDRITGNVKACLGMKQLRDGTYIAQTALNGDVREYTKEPLQIIITYSKRTADSQYKEIVRTSKSKNLDWSRIKFPKEYEYLPLPNQMKEAIALKEKAKKEITDNSL